MNILLNSLPTTLNIDNKEYKIHTDFRAWITLEIMIQKGEINPFTMARCVFDEVIPSDIKTAMKEIELFYCGGKKRENKNGSEKFTHRKIAYSFEDDAQAIFADFWQYYNIDLTQEGLHWWTFRALLDGLPEKSEFKQRIYYRTCDLKGLSKNEKKRVAKIRSMIEIKAQESSKMTLEQRNTNMLDYVKRRCKEAVRRAKNG